ncbi:MAG: ABC transporter permease [Spirochaetes bacterium]|nr:MAG: ABC transporter permease [Spirochaetota bacterium]HDN74242.1 ABC transporter permease [Archaeoglobus sp.]
MRDEFKGEINMIKSHRIKVFWYALEKYYTFFVLLILILIFSIISPMFLTIRNIINVLRQISMLTMVAAGLTICRAAGEMDLSVGALAGFTGVVVAKLIVAGVNPLISVLLTLLLGITFGFLNGILVAILGVPSLIATLGTLSIARGAALTTTNGKAIYSDFPSGFAFIGEGYLGIIPFPVVIMTIVVVITYLLLERSKLGRHLYAVGENMMAARLAGLPVTFYRILAMVLSSFMASIAGIVLVARLGSGQPTAGGEYLMEGLGAVFIGMTTFKPGQANTMGTLTGALLIGIIANGLLLLGISTYIQEIIKGAIMIAAVIAAVYKEEINI